MYEVVYVCMKHLFVGVCPQVCIGESRVVIEVGSGSSLLITLTAPIGFLLPVCQVLTFNCGLYMYVTEYTQPLLD